MRRELAAAVVERRRAVLLVVALWTLLLAAGLPAVTVSTSLEEFRGGTDANEAYDRVRSEFARTDPNTSSALLVVQSDQQLLRREAYVEQLHLQEALLANETVSRALAPGERPHGMATTVGTVLVRAERSDFQQGNHIRTIPLRPQPPVAEQVEALRGRSNTSIAVHTAVAMGLLADPNRTVPAGGPYAYLPASYDVEGNVVAGLVSGDPARTARTTAIVLPLDEDATTAERAAAETAAQAIATRELDTERASVFGEGTVNAELDRSTRDSLRIVGPLGLLFVLGVLVLAYRDPLDILLGALGVALVLVWTFGFMGWADITFNQLFVSVPVFLMGLSIDYSIHVFMRYREARTTERAGTVSAREGMSRALAGVGAALVLVTLTTAAGFLSGVVSDVQPIREFGVVSAVGIVAALVVFGAFVPALKVELDERLEARGDDRRQRAIGTGGGWLGRALGAPVTAARRAPWVVVGIALLATIAGAYGAAQVDTTFDQRSLLVDDVPEWTRDLPEPLRPGRYTATETLDLVEREGFVYQGTTAYVLVEGDVTDPESLERVQRAQDRLNESDVTLRLGTGDPGTSSPLTVMRAVAEVNESFNETFRAADTDGDGVPDRNVEGVYDALYAAEPNAARSVVHREGGEYRALLLTGFTNASAGNRAVAAELRAVAGTLSGGGLTATATGEPVALAAVTDQLFDTVVRTLLLTLGVVALLLLVVYRRNRRRASLGVVTMLPVVVALAWILGSMHLLAVPFNVSTALITAFTIGLGVDYAIHVTERYAQELDREGGSGADRPVGPALDRAVRGTGGALLGSAATTAGGFGVLVFAIVTPLQQFGLITALTIGYSFLASVVVLPALLVLWTRHVGDPT